MPDDDRCSSLVFHLSQSASLLLLIHTNPGLKTGNVCKKLDLLRLLLLLMTKTIAHLLFLRVNERSCISAAKSIETVSTNGWRWAVIWSLPICQPNFLACKTQACYWRFISIDYTGLHCLLFLTDSHSLCTWFTGYIRNYWVENWAFGERDTQHKKR
jgi:hypothetical protein